MAVAISPEQFNIGLTEVCKLVPPEVADVLNTNKEIVRESIIAGEAEDSVRNKEWFKSTSAMMAMDSSHHIAATSVSWEPNACEIAVGYAGVSVILFALGLAGLRVAANAKMARALLEVMGQETVRGLQAGFHDMWVAYKAGKNIDAANHLCAMLGELYRAGGFKAVVQVVMAEMAWYDWLYTGVVAVAQIVVWLATDLVAFVAEVALVILSTVSLWQAVEKVVTDCKLV